MRMSKVLAILFVASSLLILPGCRNLLEPSDVGSNAGMGTLSLTISKQGAERTILPDIGLGDFEFYLEFIAKSPANTNRNDTWASGSSSGTIELGAGAWELNIAAFLNGVSVAGGSLEFTMPPGGTVNGNVLLSPISGGTGTFSWNIGFPGSVVSARMEIIQDERWNYSETFYFVGPLRSYEPLTPNPGSFLMDTGQYHVIFSLQNNQGEWAVIHEILHIYQGMTSHFGYTLDEGHFPVSLRNRILSAWNNETGTWDFGSVGIMAGHFSLIGISGINDGNFGYIATLFNDIQPTLHNLEAMVDAALILLEYPVGTYHPAGRYSNQTYVMTAIANLVQNRSNIRFEWSRGDMVTVIVGHSIWVHIYFDAAIPEPVQGHLAAELARLQSEAQSGRYYITISKDETIEPHWLDFDDRTGITIILRGVGDMRTVNLAPWRTGSLFTVGSGITLELDNITLQGRDGNSSALVRVDSGGTLIMNTGSKITGNTSDQGGGVFVDEGGTFTMNDGEIYGNTSNWSSGGVFNNYGTFTMNGGIISGNTSYGSSGGVFNSGTFTMGGGVISGNTSNWEGGGVLNSGTFTMGGGVISGNTSNWEGGGVLNSGTFTMNGGAISGNTSNSHGGGVYNWGTFRISNGVIYGNSEAQALRNTARWSGASLYNCCCGTAQHGTFSNGTFTRRGDLNTTNGTIRVENGELDIVVEILFDLATNWEVQDLAVGQSWTYTWPYLVRAGDYNNVSIVVDRHEGRNALRVTAISSWAGFDLRHPGFDFQDGDFIRVEGIAETNNQMLLNSDHDGWRELGSAPVVSAGGTFVIEHTLDWHDIAAVEATNPQAIRVRGDTAGAVFIITGLTVARGGQPSSQPPVETPPGPPDLNRINAAPSLRAIWADHFPMGNIVASVSFGWQDGHEADIGNPVREHLLRRHFEILTAENEMKPDWLQGTRGNFSFGGANNIVNFAQDNSMKVHGHVLVWHSQSPSWMAPVNDRAQAIENLETHIETVMRHFGTSVDSWEVLNEVFSSWVSGTPTAATWRNFLRQPASNESDWPNAIPLDPETGNCFIWYAFTTARRVADDIDRNAGRPVGTMVLYYNDYNEEASGKREGIFFMVQEMNTRFAAENNGRRLIDAIGMQAHHHRGHVSGEDARPGWTRQSTAAEVQTAISRFASLGVYVSITELDITVGNTEVAPLTAAQERAQAIRYAELFRMFRNNAQYLRRVSIWGINDNASWRFRGSPLLWDAYLRPKEAFWAVADPDAFLANPSAFARGTSIEAIRAAAVNIPASAWD